MIDRRAFNGAIATTVLAMTQRVSAAASSPKTKRAAVLPMRRIALEEHFVVNKPAHVERWKSLISEVPASVVDKILPVLADVGNERLDAMSAAGIDMAVLSDGGSLQGVIEAAPALQLARESNDYLAKMIQKHPTRYAGFAAVPLVDPEAGARELERAVTHLGLKGALINGATNGHYLDDAQFNPFWAQVQALDVPVYLHPGDPLVMPVTYAGCPELIGATWSWTAETAAHALRLIYNGVFTRYPKAKVILGHMGESLPYLLWRIDRRTQAFAIGAYIKPSDIFRAHFAITTSGVFADEPFLCALKVLGSDFLMYSVDYPFESMQEASSWFDQTPVSEQVREQISWKNAARLLKL